jgi:hypothetical protein
LIERWFSKTGSVAQFVGDFELILDLVNLFDEVALLRAEVSGIRPPGGAS